MAVTKLNSTMIGAYTPICNDCGATADYDVGYFDYFIAQEEYDGWLCEACHPKTKEQYRRKYASQNQDWR